MEVGEKYPDTYFLLGTGYKTLDNTTVYDVDLEAGGYLMGIIAGLATVQQSWRCWPEAKHLKFSGDMKALNWVLRP